MMKQIFSIACILFVMPTGMAAQTAADILIFSVEGNILIKRDNKAFPAKRAALILSTDTIQVKKGTVSLVDRNLKRVTLEKKGNYSYRQLVKKFEKVNASLENRFLVQVLDKMIHEQKPVAIAGGVVRGNVNAGLPADSAIILSDSIRFTFFNPLQQQLAFYLMDADHKLLFSKTTADSLLVIQHSTSPWWKPGLYYREAVIAGKPGTAEKSFIIPGNAEREAYLDEYRQLKKAFARFPLKTRNELLDAVKAHYRWVVY